MMNKSLRVRRGRVQRDNMKTADMVSASWRRSRVRRSTDLCGNIHEANIGQKKAAVAGG